jgi:hypothetical protein
MDTAAKFGSERETGSAPSHDDRETTNENGTIQKGLSPDGIAEHSPATSLLLNHVAPLAMLAGHGAASGRFGTNCLVSCLSTAFK